MNTPQRLTALRSMARENPLLLAIAGIGFAVSFQTIARVATQQHMPGWPVLYPVLIDLGILGMVVEARKAIEDRRSDAVPRLLAWVLAAFTIYVNAHGSPAGDWVGVTLHVAAPGLWVAFLELTRWRKLRKARAGKPEGIPLARWAFMPVRTLGMKKRMIVHHVLSYPVAVAREEALMLAVDLVRAETGRRWRKTAPAVLRHHLSTGTLPEAVSRAAEGAAYGTMPSMAEPVSAWVIDALTQATRTAVKVKAEKHAIEASVQASESPATDSAPARQTARHAPGGSRAVKHARVRRLLTDNPGMTREEVARKAGVSVSTVDRIKRDMPTPLRPRAAVAE